MKKSILLLVSMLFSIAVTSAFSKGMKVSRIKLVTDNKEYLCLDEGISDYVTFDIEYFNSAPRVSDKGKLELKINGPGYFTANNTKEYSINVKNKGVGTHHLNVYIKCEGGSVAQIVELLGKGDGESAYARSFPDIKIYNKSKYEDLKLSGLDKLLNGQTSKYEVERKCSVLDPSKTKWYIDSTSSGDAQIISTKGLSAEVKALGGSVTLCADVYSPDNKLVKTLRKRVEAPYKFSITPSVNVLCNAGDIVTYTLSNPTQIVQTEWSLKNNSGAYTIISSSNSEAVVRVNTINKSIIEIDAKITTKENTIVNTFNRSTWVGSPQLSIKPVLNVNEFVPRKTYQFKLSGAVGEKLTNVKWETRGLITIFRQEEHLDHAIAYGEIHSTLKGGSFHIIATASNLCGLSSQAQFMANVEVTSKLELPGDGGIFFRKLPIQYKSVDIFNFPGGVLLKKLTNVENFDITNENLASGIYLIRFTDQDDNVTTEKVKL